MMASATAIHAAGSFHVRHDLSPPVARDALLLLRAAPSPDGPDLLRRAREHDLELGQRRSVDKVVGSLRDLGFVERPASTQVGLRLTPLGRQLADVAARDPLLLGELVHQRHWWLWSPERGGPAFAWAYTTVARTLWADAPAEVDRDRLVAAVIDAAEQRFGLDAVSFSGSSVLGVLHWLRTLRPPCMAGSRFQRRLVCPPEALVITLAGCQARAGLPSGVPVRLDARTRTLACQALLLEEASLDEAIATAEESLGMVRQSGDGRDLLLIGRPLFAGLILGAEEQ